MVSLEAWLAELGLSKYNQVFVDLEVDMEVMADLTESDLEKINIPLGPRKKIIKAIALLTADQQNSSSHTSTRHSSDVAPERRQLTVMFADLVGSTSLSERFDPEDLSEIISLYRSTSERVINRYAGTTARYLGDGLLVYFGYPKAHEDDAERAIRAGLEMVEAVSDISVFGLNLEVRVGIATGSVVVGEIIGEGSSQEHAIYGETPNLASRLQSVALPNTLVISNQSWLLAGAMFECVDLGLSTLKGFSEPVRLWQPTSVKTVESRFEANQGNAESTEFIGRQSEIEALADHWQLAKKGLGQLVTLSGEAGMGKSRLIHELRSSIAGQPHLLLRFYCTAYHQASALFPIISQLERASGIYRNDTAATKLDKLIQLLETSGHDVGSTAALFASLLSIPLDGRLPELDLAPSVQREKTIGALLKHILSLSTKQPLLVIFEDLHWIDPTSLDLLQRTAQQIANANILFIVTSRPEFDTHWIDETHTSVYVMDRLNQTAVQQLILTVSGGKALPVPLVESILAKSDGTPLFVEELTKTVLASDFLTDTGTSYELNQTLPKLAVPNTLKDSLMARLNHTASVRETAQIGAAIGRNFFYELLAMVSPLTENSLLQALDELQEAELVYCKGAPPNSRYTFKHALVQDASYDSLLRAVRQSLHERIATTIEQKFPETVGNQPELLAHHFTQANMLEQAVSYWFQAGQRAIGRSNYLESVSHCRKGLEILEECPASESRSEKELEFRAILGVGLVATMGYAAEEIAENYARSRDICNQLGETPALIPTLYGLWVYHLLRGNRESTFELAGQLYQYTSDTSLPLVTNSALAISTFYSGDRNRASVLLTESMNRFDASHHAEMALAFGDDADLLPSFYEYWNQWLSGYPDKALLHLQQTDKQVGLLGTPYLVATGMLFHMILKHELRDIQGVADSAIRFETHSTEQGFPFFVALANIGSAWSRVQDSKDDNHVQAIIQGVANYRLTGARLPVSYWLHYLAQAQLQCGDIGAGLDSVDEALALTDELLDDFYKPELLRIKGELLLQQESRTEQAEASFRQSLDLSQKNQSKMFELRASVSLSRLMSARGDVAEARTLLSKCYEWFTEGFDTVDLRDAKQLLDSYKSVG